MNIEPTDLVLEIGSGDRPFPRSDVLCDLYPEATLHRKPKSKIVIDRPFVISNGQQLPFQDHSFDYVIASHVLEHTDNPKQFLDELQRVARRGFLAFPQPLIERFYVSKPHQWFCFWDGKLLKLIRKQTRKQPTVSQERLFLAWLRRNGHRTNTEFEWNRQIHYKIIKKEDKTFTQKYDNEIQHILEHENQKTRAPQLLLYCKDAIYNGLLYLINKLQYQKRRFRPEVALYSLLCCPKCKSTLLFFSQKISCKKCKRNYAYYQGKIPLLT